MSEIQRFWCHEASNIRCVRETDFDRVAAENLALQHRLTTADQRIDELEAQAPVPPRVDAQPVAIERARKIEALRGAFEQRFKLDIWPVIDWLRNSGVYTHADAGEVEAKLTAKEKEWTDRFHMVCECAIRPIVLERNSYQAERDTLRAELAELQKAARTVMEDAIDGALVHPCDEHSEDVKARTLAQPYQALYRVLCASAEPAKS